MKDELLAKRLRLYLICGEGLTPGRMMQKVSSALNGGVTAVQLRAKTWSSREIYMAACELREMTKKHGALFIVNDRLDIALACKADGAHLGQSDIPICAAREAAGPGFVIGGTARTPDFALEAEKSGADYIGCGSAFATKTKDDAVVIGPGGIKKVTEQVKIPVVAVGGITAENAYLLAGCGCSGISLSAGIMRCDDPEESARALYRIANLITDRQL